MQRVAFRKRPCVVYRMGWLKIKNEIITYNDGSLELNVPVSWDEETVWLTRLQMADLFDRDVKTIGKHINNALMEELDHSTVAKFATNSK